MLLFSISSVVSLIKALNVGDQIFPPALSEKGGVVTEGL